MGKGAFTGIYGATSIPGAIRSTSGMLRAPERSDVDRMLDIAAIGLEKLFAAQAEAFASVKR